MSGTATAVALSTAAPATRAEAVQAPSPLDVKDRGAAVPFKEQEAEYASTNGSLIGPDRIYGTLPSEASGRQAVTLDAVGEYVEFTLTAPANAMSFRYSTPDNAAGTGRDASIDLKVDGNQLKSVPATSKYSWYYGVTPSTTTRETPTRTTSTTRPGPASAPRCPPARRSGSRSPRSRTHPPSPSTSRTSSRSRRRPANPPERSTSSATSARTPRAPRTRPPGSRRPSTRERRRTRRSTSPRAPSRSATTSWWTR